jgi:hypothetical protein
VSRLHTDVVEVARRDDEPAHFLWRGRLYLVREVLARWTESGGWWRGASLGASVDDREQDWFRVEAGAGRAVGTGVYDLCFDWSTGSWSLARVLD